MSQKQNNDGFAHQMLIVGIVVIAGLALVFTLVLRSNNKSSNKTSTPATSQTTVSKNTNSTTQQPASQAQPSGQSSTGTSIANKSTGTTPSTKQTQPSSASQSPASPTQTPLSALTTLVENLEKGSPVNITASNVSVPGPVSTAQARPIVFSVNNQTYFAYRQGQAPNFTTTPSVTANSMAIVVATGSPSLVQAHLDKAGNLVDPNISNTLVGYSQGGN